MSKKALYENLAGVVLRLRKGNITEAAQGIPLVVQGLRQLTEGKPDAAVKDLAVAVRGIVSSFEKRDFVLMADLIEFEILPLLRGDHGE